MNANTILFLAFAILCASQQAFAQSCAAEAQTRRGSCGDLVKPIPSTATPAASTPTTTPAAPGNAPTTTTIATSEGVCTCTCESSATDSPTSDASPASGVTGGAVSGAPGGGSGGEAVNCLLIEYFYNISVLLTGEDYELFIEWIHEIQVTILADISLSYEEQVVQIGFSLKAFFSEHIEIQEVLYYEQLGSWGFVVDFIYVAYQIQIEITQEIVTLDVSGDCSLFDALRNATAGNSAQAAIVEELIFNITIILQQSSWTYSQQQAQIYLLFQEFFVQYSQWESFFLSIQIEGYGLLEYYFKVAFWYEEIVTISVVIGGDVSDCVLLQALTEASQNTSFSVSVRSEFQQLEEKLSTFFAENVDVSVRLNYVVSQCYSLFQLVGYMEIYVDQVSCGSWGFIYDLIFCSDICINCGCGNPDNGPGTLPPSSGSSSVQAETTEAVTTEAATTVAPTTEAVTTVASTTVSTSTAVPAADCSSRWSQLAIDVSSNTTFFTTSVGNAYATWSASNRASFTTYWNQIRNAIWSTTFSHSEILSKVVTACSSFNGNNAAKQQILYNVTITEWFGTVGQFVACGSTL